jgi:hypothetical protein
MAIKHRTHVHWNDEDKLKLARRSLEIINDPLFTGGRLRAVQQAQSEVIPASLHRNINAMQKVTPWIEILWRELRKPQRSEPTEHRAIQPVVDPHIERQSVSKEELLSQIPTADLMREFVTRIEAATSPDALTKIVRAEINTILERRLPGVLAPDEEPNTKHNPEPEPEAQAKPKLHRVLVIGLSNKQQQILRQIYSGIVDFYFLEGSEGTNRIRNQAQTMDFTVMSGWSKGVVGSTHGWPNFSFASGGMESIHRAIRSKFKLEPKK